MGKGASIRDGLKEVTGNCVIFQDADLECVPKDYLRLIKPIEEGKADVVYGSRFLMREDARRVFYFRHYIGNRILTTLSNIFTNLHLTDMETCYKVFRKEIIEKISITEKRFGLEPEITAKLAKLGCRIYEVGISYYGRSIKEGKKIRMKDGIRAVYCILKFGILHFFDRK
jgi:glycosyltransferase involved in cell wall biosynthesis